MKTKSQNKRRGRPHLREEERALRCKHLLDAAATCFSRKGLHKTTMEDIARETGYSAATLYLYFKDKNDLYRAMFETKVAELMKKLDVCREEPDPRTAIERLVRIVFEHWQGAPGQSRIYVSERAGFEGNIESEFGREVYDQYQRYIKLVEFLCRKGVRGGAFQGDPAILARMLVGMMNSIVFYWLRSETPGSLSAQADEVARFFIAGSARRRER